MLDEIDFPTNFDRNPVKFIFIKSEFSSVSIKVLKVEMDSTPSNFNGAPNERYLSVYVSQISIFMPKN